jgi:hypothetical protein
MIMENDSSATFDWHHLPLRTKLLILALPAFAILFPFVWVLFRWGSGHEDQATRQWLEQSGGADHFDLPTFLEAGMPIYPRAKFFDRHESLVFGEPLTVVRVPEGVSDLSFLQRLSHVRAVLISNSKVQDLTPLSRLTGLRHLHIRSDHVVDLAVLGNLTRLESLAIYDAPIQNLGPLSNLKNLKRLYLCNTEVADITPISDLKNLYYINLKGSPVSDLEPLSALPFLYELNLEETQVSDLSPLQKLANFHVLFFNREPHEIQEMRLHRPSPPTYVYVGEFQIPKKSSKAPLIQRTSPKPQP